MAEMSRLVAAFFDSGEEAEDGARRLVAWMRSNPAARLQAVTVLRKDEDGSVSKRKLGPREARKGAGIGLAAGVIAAVASGGVTLVQGMLVGAAAGGALGSLFHRSLRTAGGELERIGGRLDPGHAAIAALVPERQAPAVAEKLEEYGGSLETPTTTPAPLPVSGPVVSPG